MSISPTMAIAMIMAITATVMYIIRSVVDARFVVGVAVGAGVAAGRWRIMLLRLTMDSRIVNLQS